MTERSAALSALRSPVWFAAKVCFPPLCGGQEIMTLTRSSWAARNLIRALTTTKAIRCGRASFVRPPERQSLDPKATYGQPFRENALEASLYRPAVTKRSAGRGSPIRRPEQSRSYRKNPRLDRRSSSRPDEGRTAGTVPCSTGRSDPSLIHAINRSTSSRVPCETPKIRTW